MEKKTKVVYEEPQMNVVELETGSSFCVQGSVEEGKDGYDD